MRAHQRAAVLLLLMVCLGADAMAAGPRRATLSPAKPVEFLPPSRHDDTSGLSNDDVRRPVKVAPPEVTTGDHIVPSADTAEEDTANMFDRLPPLQSAGTQAATPPWHSLNGGGRRATSTTYMSTGSIGQSVIGPAGSANRRAGIGFWYGVGRPAAACACDCHADPECDGIISNVFDVVRVVEVAFRNGAAMPDPNPACPREQTDVDCNGVTNVFDVVRVVEVAFRNGEAATVYCQPCP